MLERVLAVLVALALLLLAFRPARAAVAQVDYPYDVDQFRDLAAAQSFADGRGLQDPFYRGETIWYNPGLPIAVAAISRLRGLDVSHAYVQAGPFVNAAAPVAFFVMAAVLTTPMAALVGLAWYLFSPTLEPPWARPGFSPWIFPINFGAAFFYCGLILCSIAAQRRSRIWWAVLGVDLGIAFLAHTAAAIMLGIAALSAIWYKPRREWGRETLLATALVVIGAATLSAPFLWSIVGRYHLHVVNDAPVNWVWPDIDRKHIPALVRRAVSPWTAVFFIGLVAVWRRAGADIRARLTITWFLAAAVFFVYGWLQQLLRFANGPMLVPQYHFYFYLTAACYLLIGVGAYVIADGAIALLNQVRTRPALRATVASLIVTGVALWFARHNYSRYLGRADFDEYLREARSVSDDLTRTMVLQRIRSQTPEDAVVLASPEDSLYRVAPAGRFVVAVAPEFSNPYVSFAARQTAQNEMLGAIAEGDLQKFRTASRSYGVTHVLLGPAGDASPASRAASARWLRLLSDNRGYSLYAIDQTDASSAR